MEKRSRKRDGARSRIIGSVGRGERRVGWGAVRHEIASCFHAIHVNDKSVVGIPIEGEAVA